MLSSLGKKQIPLDDLYEYFKQCILSLYLSLKVTYAIEKRKLKSKYFNNDLNKSIRQSALLLKLI